MTLTVADLMEKLAAYDPDMRVLVVGYEGGYDDPDELRVQEVRYLGYEDRYHGEYVDSYPWRISNEVNFPFDALVIPR
jgi:hypothetical protein